MKLIATSAALLSILGVAAAADNFFDHHSIRQGGQRSLQGGGNQIACSDDVKECDDGSFVKRNPNKCREFLPCPEKTIVKGVYFQELSQEQLAQQLGVPLGTVKSRLRLALAKLKVHIDRKSTRLNSSHAR